jgi:hypothetical protein
MKNLALKRRIAVLVLAALLSVAGASVVATTTADNAQTAKIALRANDGDALDGALGADDGDSRDT